MYLKIIYKYRITMSEKDCPIYRLHQTDKELAKELIKYCDIKSIDILYEPFAGNNAFYDNFPEGNEKHRTEITDGLDYDDFEWEEKRPNVVITNPPFILKKFERRKRANSFFMLLYELCKNKYLDKICFFCNSACFNSITPHRTELINDEGFFLQKIVAVKTKKWYGTYYLMVYTRD
jgi:hypothetical protein